LALATRNVVQLEAKYSAEKLTANSLEAYGKKLILDCLNVRFNQFQLTGMKCDLLGNLLIYYIRNQWDKEKSRFP